MRLWFRSGHIRMPDHVGKPRIALYVFSILVIGSVTLLTWAPPAVLQLGGTAVMALYTITVASLAMVVATFLAEAAFKTIGPREKSFLKVGWLCVVLLMVLTTVATVVMPNDCETSMFQRAQLVGNIMAVVLLTATSAAFLTFELLAASGKEGKSRGPVYAITIVATWAVMLNVLGLVEVPSIKAEGAEAR
jgi:hypothetical protein